MPPLNSTYWSFKRVITASVGVGVPLIALFTYLALSGALNVTGYSYTAHCAGTPSDLCYLYLNFTPQKDIYIQADSQWLDTTPPIKSIKLQRTWGSSWRTIDLTKPWSTQVKYALKLSKGQDYQFRFIAEKYDPRDVINWSINPTGIWKEALPRLDYDYKTITYYEPVEHYKTEEVCNNIYEPVKCVLTKMGTVPDGIIQNKTGCYKVSTVCRDVTVVDYVEQVKKTKEEKVKDSTMIKYAEETVKIKDIEKKNTKCGLYGCDKWCESEEAIIDGVCTDLPDSDGDGICSVGESDCTNTIKYTDKIEVSK